MRIRNYALGEGLAALSRFETDSYSRKGLLYKLLLALLSRYDIPGLEYHSSAVGRLFKSGLGRFGLGQVSFLVTFYLLVAISLFIFYFPFLTSVPFAVQTKFR